MCLAVPARIISMEDAFAKVDMMGFETSVFIQLIENANIGDYVLIHAGCAIEKINQSAFDCYENFYREIMEAEDKCAVET